MNKFFRSSQVIVCILLTWVVAISCLHADTAQNEREKTYKELEIFANVLSILQENYVDEIDSKKVIDGAIRGLLYSLDPHSSYLKPEEFTELQEETQGSFSGIGIEISVENATLRIISPIEGTPAYKAGLKAKDIIVEIDGVKTVEMGTEEAIKRLRGPKGSTVKIAILRDEWKESQTFTLVRDMIPLQSVKSFFIAPNIIYSRITNFQSNTTDDFKKALQALHAKQQVNGLILDLRNNPGGLLNQAVSLSDLFLSSGTIVYTKGRTEEQNMVFSAHNAGDEPKYPLVILVNEGSASASEIVAGAMQAQKRGVLVGVRTFGKGSVQTIIPLPEGAGLRLTTARYYTPDNRSIQGKGIMPDVEVPVATANSEVKIKAKNKNLLHENSGASHPAGSESEPSSGPESSADMKMQLANDNQLRTALVVLKNLIASPDHLTPIH